MSERQEIFVFGSNLAGRHGRGSALHAAKHWGAQPGIGEGRTGMSYAIPTKDEDLQVLGLDAIANSVFTFLVYADSHPELLFRVVKIGCGLAGYHEGVIIPLFFDVPDNVLLPDGWAS